MRFDPLKWSEFAVGDSFKTDCGRIWARCTDPGAIWYVQAHGVEAIAGFGHELDVRVAGDVTVTCVPKSKSGVRLFVYDPANVCTEAKGEIYTNVDRRPMESGNLLEVRRALREMLIEKQAFRREIQEERRRAREKREADQAEPPAPAEPDQEGDQVKPEPDDQGVPNDAV